MNEVRAMEVSGGGRQLGEFLVLGHACPHDSTNCTPKVCHLVGLPLFLKTDWFQCIPVIDFQ